MPQSAPPPQPDIIQVQRVVSEVRPVSPVAQQVHTAVTQMHTVAGTGYSATLDTLRRSVAEATPAIEQLYHAAPEADYMQRWSLVKVLVDLQHPSALTSLNAIVNTPLPPAQGEEAQFTLAEETIIRTTAAEEIGRQAMAGQAAALTLLLNNCQNPIFSVKQVSVQAYLAQGGPTARATLQKMLPANEQFILDIRNIGAGELAQPDAGAVKPRLVTREMQLPLVQGGAATMAVTGDAPTHTSK